MDDHAESGRNGAEKEPRSDAAVAPGEPRGQSDSSGADGAQSGSEAIDAVRGLVEQVLEEGLSRVRGGGGKLGTRASRTVNGMLSEFGVAQKRDHEDLELRIAQLEHRVRLLESARDAAGEATSSPTAPATGDSRVDESSSDDS